MRVEAPYSTEYWTQYDWLRTKPRRAPFWRRRSPWLDLAVILLLIAALVAVVHFGGGRLETFA